MKKHELRIEAIRMAENVAIGRGYGGNIESIIEDAEKCYSFLVKDDKEVPDEETKESEMDQKPERTYPYIGKSLSNGDQVFFMQKETGALLKKGEEEELWKTKSRLWEITGGWLESNFEVVYTL